MEHLDVAGVAQLVWILAQPLLWTGLLLVARLLPSLLLVPAFGGLRTPSMVRMGLLAVLVVGCWPAAAAPTPRTLVDAAPVLTSQAIFGFAIALAGFAVFEAVKMAGRLGDQVLGRGSFGASDPLGQGGSTPLANLYGLLLLAVFFATGGHLLLIRAFVAGYETLPIDGQLGAVGPELLMWQATSLTADALTTAVALVIPAIVASLLVDLTLGWFNRFMPTLQATFMAMPLRGLVGWLVIAGTLAVSLDWAVQAVPDAYTEATEAMSAP